MRQRAMKRSKMGWLAATALLLCAALLYVLNTRGESPLQAVEELPNANLAARGAYLAKAGNCMGCHTAPGSVPYSGGRGIATPFGTVYAPNLTPDVATGLGSWNAAHFWRALHNGRSKDGRLLYPVFPYENYTLMPREDSDALFEFFKQLPPVPRANTPHALRFPVNTQLALGVWRALYFSPASQAEAKALAAPEQRGKYLVQGLGHCSACHTARNALGASTGPALGGGLIPVQNWYAPSLIDRQQAGMGDWSEGAIAALLKNGIASDGPRHAAINGPMAEVVTSSTQHLNEADLRAMAGYLKGVSPEAIRAADQTAVSMPSAPSAVSAQGAKLYEQHCLACHGAAGQGQSLNTALGQSMAYPPLAGNRAVLMTQTANLVQMVLNGGYAPATPGNPRPFGMPPYVLVLDDAEIAAVVSHIRQSWGNQASTVSPLDVNRIRAATAN
jgi:mono/diheme cytochrome c family protein